MQKLTLSFLNSKSPIPIVCFPLTDGKSIYAIIDTGSDSTVYDKNAKESYPEMFIKTKHIGKHQVVGVNETTEMDIYMSGLRLNVQQENEEIIALKLVAFEHCTFDSVSKPLVEREGLPGNIPLLIGSDTLIRYNAKIDMRGKSISFCVRKTA